VTEYRAVFDADVTFRNEGGLQVQGFRLDVPGPQVDPDRIAALFVAHLGLLMVDRVRLHDLRVVPEPHRGSRDTGVAPAATTRVVDLSHPVTAGMVTFPGLPGPQISPHLSREESRRHYSEGTEFVIDRLTLVGNTGTYLECPFHRFPAGTDLGQQPLDLLVDLPTAVIHLAGAGRPAIDVPALAATPVEDRAVLLHTGWDRHWGTPAYGGPGAPHLTAAAADWLVEAGALLVGIDAVNLDDLADAARPAHTALLSAGVPILENLTNLAALPAEGARLHAAPPALHGMGAMTVRAYALMSTG
jgi:arylformamidase